MKTDEPTVQSRQIHFSKVLKDFRGYQPSIGSDLHKLPLDRTEPPIPYRKLAEPIIFDVGRYPDARLLQSAFAQRYGVAAENILVTAGADEAIDRVCRAFLTNEDCELVTLAPTFEMIAHYAALAGATVRSANWMSSFPIDELMALVTERTRLIVIVSPNNPTGSVAPVVDIVSLAERFPNIPILLDLAYVEFAEIDPTLQLANYPNIIITRTLSKAYGLPGLRIGCAIAAPFIIKQLASCGGPYSVSSLSLSIACSALIEDKESLCRYVKRIKTERQEFCLLLDALAIAYFRSESNFILLRPLDAIRFDRALTEASINTRAFSRDPVLSGLRRITMPGNEPAFDQLVKAISQATKEL
jgi:histidinol-phosphate aminotransferase